MKSQKISTKKMAFLLSSIGVLACANANQFEPATTPIFTIPQAKPNIHMLLDDSASMLSVDVIAPEHTFGFGQPTCQNQSSEWHDERSRYNEYDPFQDGKYKPWDDSKADSQGLIGGKKKPPRIMNCAFVKRTEALDHTVSSLLYKYRENAYLGISVLWQVNNQGYGSDVVDSVIRLPIGDYGQLDEVTLKKEVIDPISKLIQSSPGQTPLYPAAYEAIKMFRGQPVTLAGVNSDQVKIVKDTNTDEYYYPYKLLETPLRYRCQQNHLIIMTDGLPNKDNIWGVDVRDNVADIWAGVGTHRKVNDLNIGYDARIPSGDLIGQMTSKVDLRYAHKPILKNGQWVEKTLDDAGKSWTDNMSTPMPIITHSVSLFVDPLDPVYLSMTGPTGGMNLGFGQGDGNAEDLLLAFDTIFSSIIKSTSSTVATNDQSNSAVLEGNPVSSNGDVDLSKVGSIRYDTTYNFDQQMGNIRAIVPYVKAHTEIAGEDHIEIDTVELWNTDRTVKAEQGNYLTYLKSDDQKRDERIYLTNPKVADQFKAIHNASKYGEPFNDFYIPWLMKGGIYEGGNGLRSRLLPMGSITNSDLVLANKDILHINIAKEKMAQSLAKEMVDYVKYKAHYQPVNHLIVSDNDGFINFVNAQRGLTGSAIAGARNTAYFPQLLAHRLDEIASENRPATLVLEGKSKLVDAKVYDASYGDLYATIGLSSMGSGGKGIVGYRIFGAPVDLKNPPNDLLENVKPLFEITNDGPESFRTKGFEDLGYTYSGFEIFNRVITENNKKRGQAVAVFGNGFGADKSIVYFIDAYTGEKLHEIVLNPKGGGASTPSIVVQSSMDGQGLNRIYVGDYSGTLYKVNFNGKDLNDGSATVTALFQAAAIPNNYGQSAISVKPLVTKNKSTGLYSVAFGTGNATSSNLDRGKNSLVEHSVYNVVDHNNIMNDSTATVTALSKPTAVSLSALLTIKDLNVGKVDYTQGANINYYSEEKHDLEITAPTSSNQNANRNGWAMRLIADGTKSGERTIQNAKYDSENNNIVFVTWGMYESNVKFEEGVPEDPCISDMAFGKVLSFDADTGKSSGKKGIYNKGTTGTAEGGLTGAGIVESPEGNDIADLNDFQEGLEDEISIIVGEDNSSHPSQEDTTKLDCVGDIFGKPSCTEFVVEEKHEPLPHGRVNFKKINAYY